MRVLFRGAFISLVFFMAATAATMGARPKLRVVRCGEREQIVQPGERIVQAEGVEGGGDPALCLALAPNQEYAAQAETDVLRGVRDAIDKALASPALSTEWRAAFVRSRRYLQTAIAEGRLGVPPPQKH